jgi:hypothetical protein
MKILFVPLLAALAAQEAAGFQTTGSPSPGQVITPGHTDLVDFKHALSRRLFVDGAKASIAAALTVVLSTERAGAAGGAAAAEDTLWITGKAPKVPGQKPKDKTDVSGTRKDPNFLRSLSDCKGQCERTPTSDGYAKSKEDCLSECQDICCATYEQCTFGIVPRI